MSIDIRRIEATGNSGHVPVNRTLRSGHKKYGENIIISGKTTYSTTVCFKNKEHDVLSDNWYKHNENNEKVRIPKAAGDLIRSEIRSIPCETNFYPPSDKMFIDVNIYIPKLLSYFLDEVF